MDGCPSIPGPQWVPGPPTVDVISTEWEAELRELLARPWQSHPTHTLSQSFCIHCLLGFETGSHCVDQASLELTEILQALPLECFDESCVLPCLVSEVSHSPRAGWGGITYPA